MTSLKKVIIPATIIGTGIWATLIERNLFKLRKETLRVLPKGSADFKVLHISDLHLAPWQRRKSDWVRKLADLEPDLVVITGDLLGHKDALPTLKHTLEPFKGLPGVYVFGSNDFYGPILKNPLKYLQSPSRLSTKMPDLDTPQLIRVLDDLGFVRVDNAATDVGTDKRNVRVFGLADPHVRYDRPDLLEASAASLKSDFVGLKFGVVHAPYKDSLNELLKYKPDIIFSGHTHGGQVRVPFVGALTSNSDLPNAQARGLSVWYDESHAAFLHVSAGLGTSIFAPIRFACPPEANLLTLTA